jgi:hypothetical protein
MHKQELSHLQGRIEKLNENLRVLSADDDLIELIRLIKHPGWTTPAEFTLVSGIVDHMLQSVQTLTTLKSTLLAGSREVAPALEKS